MKKYAFIFARGGSKGLPRKNIKHLLGKPLIVYSIETALNVTDIDRVFISTDDHEIASIGLAAGAEVIPRPEHLAGDSSPEWLSWQHAVNWVTSKYGEFEQFISLPATSPLRSVEDVKSAMHKLHISRADICITTTPSNRSPYFNMIKETESGFIELVNNEGNAVFRRQDVPQVYDITTVVYVSTPHYILNETGLFAGNVTHTIIPKERAVDIDDIYDFKLAEAILSCKGQVC
ncbi:acylneuraminate cytidylyltransferase family protein [Shewanella sp. D64]|uniref:acylneuraminate cytidylyltransferase family protein n=1 Tax=unclassified Shewanella TaxID=196818 RepID=UPI0022BA4012|nr:MULTISPECIES: acylneuraminate cytidylyltransferase family protein [unclassified Shewanella]MEC4726565.1 acylneuraminate cytidylyltransferase family protein [Shewanella sp. D64]MEC4737394.1 acylneuraminate cytidylyltransferase family protein [Shewanella sp. E94]WBJ97213.1 acylneuraminate cytidylyltransferase family protein [Shewanella sp. MTB7]